MADMDKLETYNRVPSLESQRVKTILIACYLINVIAAIACVMSYWVAHQPLPYALLGVAVSLVVGVLLLNYDNHRQKYCRYCGSALSSVIRPLVLNQEFLSMDGKKMGDWFFTPRKVGLFGKVQWVKMSNQALVCHSCRLTETTHRVVQEPVSASELEPSERV